MPKRRERISSKRILTLKAGAFDLFRLGYSYEALNFIDEIIKIDPENEEAWFHRAEIFEQHFPPFWSKDIDRYKDINGTITRVVDPEWDKEALKSYNKVLKINPKNIEALLRKAALLSGFSFLSPQPKIALKCCNKVLKIDSRNKQAHLIKEYIKKEMRPTMEEIDKLKELNQN